MCAILDTHSYRFIRDSISMCLRVFMEINRNVHYKLINRG